MYVAGHQVWVRSQDIGSKIGEREQWNPSKMSSRRRHRIRWSVGEAECKSPAMPRQSAGGLTVRLANIVERGGATPEKTSGLGETDRALPRAYTKGCDDAR